MQTAVMLTDAKPLPRDHRCPMCHADESRRVVVAGFGVPQEACGQCGHKFEGSTR
jgi:DNA polymerase III alpha subunit (gram-positive type)